MDRADTAVSNLLHVLEVAAVLLGLLALLGLWSGVLRSIAQVALGRSTLVLPFWGGESAAWVADVLAAAAATARSDALDRTDHGSRAHLERRRARLTSDAVDSNVNCLGYSR